MIKIKIKHFPFGNQNTEKEIEQEGCQSPAWSGDLQHALAPSIRPQK